MENHENCMYGERDTVQVKDRLLPGFEKKRLWKLWIRRRWAVQINKKKLDQ